jgi:hypothetical protein
LCTLRSVERKERIRRGCDGLPGRQGDEVLHARGADGDFDPACIALERAAAEVQLHGEAPARERKAAGGEHRADLIAGAGGVEEAELKVGRACHRGVLEAQLALVREGS